MCPIANHQSPSECHNSHLHGHTAPARSLHCLPWCTKLGALAARRRENSHWHGHTAPTRSPHCLPWCTKLGFMPPLQIIALATRQISNYGAGPGCAKHVGMPIIPTIPTHATTKWRQIIIWARRHKSGFDPEYVVVRLSHYDCRTAILSTSRYSKRHPPLQPDETK